MKKILIITLSLITILGYSLSTHLLSNKNNSTIFPAFADGTIAECGNGKVEAGEDCDGTSCPTGYSCENCQCVPNCYSQAVPACSGSCPSGQQCINVEGFNQCTCRLNSCGNNVKDDGEQCDGSIGCSDGQYCLHCKCVTPCGGTHPNCMGDCPTGQSCTAGVLMHICACRSTPTPTPTPTQSCGTPNLLGVCPNNPSCPSNQICVKDGSSCVCH